MVVSLGFDINLHKFFRYSYDETLYAVVTSITIPNGLFIISFIILLYWHSPYCKRKKLEQANKKKVDKIDDEGENMINDTN